MNFKIKPDSIKRYIQRRGEDYLSLKAALSENNFDHIRHIAHQIKGNAATFGFEDLGERAAILEENALRSDSKNLRQDLEWIESWLLRNESLLNIH